MPQRKRSLDEEPSYPPPPCTSRLVFPGDHLVDLHFFDEESAPKEEAQEVHTPVTLGHGVVRDASQLRATMVGIARWDAHKRRIWLESAPRRYVPATGDQVVGIVAEKHAEEYRLNVGSAALATLPVLAFDGATKRNRPHLDVGTLVYARISQAHRSMEAEATCAAPPGVGARDWVTNESVFGELAGGYVFSCPIPLCRRLSGADEYPALEAVGTLVPFELAVGVNGRVWIRSGSAAATVLTQLAILQSERVADEEHARLVEEIMHRFDLEVAASGEAE